LDPLTLYFDRCFGARLPEAIRKASPPFKIEYQHDKKGKHKFKQDTPDDKWLAIVGASGWIVLSHDRKFHQIEAECAAIKQHKIGCFYLWGNNAPVWDKLRCFMKAHERILDAVKTNPRPFIFEIGRLGHLKPVKIP
jgi:hypothetical protein